MNSAAIRNSIPIIAIVNTMIWFPILLFCLYLACSSYLGSSFIEIFKKQGYDDQVIKITCKGNKIRNKSTG